MPDKLIRVDDPNSLVAILKNAQSKGDSAVASKADTIVRSNQIFRPLPIGPPTKDTPKTIARPRGNDSSAIIRNGRTVRVNTAAITQNVSKAATRPMRPNVFGGIFNTSNPQTSGAASSNSRLADYLRNNKRGG